MGYCMNQGAVQFCIKAAKKHAAWKATRPLLEETTKMGGYSYSGSKTTRHWSWVDMGDFQMSKTIEGVLEAWRWEPEVDEKTGDVIGLEFHGEKLGDDEVLWKAIAPFVESGSFIEMHGEDGGQWTWNFVDGKLKA